MINDVDGNAQPWGACTQDRWAFASTWRAVLGARLENWTANDDFTKFSANSAAYTRYGSRSENFVSPKGALSYQWTEDTVLKASVERAVRMLLPETVSVVDPFSDTAMQAGVSAPNWFVTLALASQQVPTSTILLGPIRTIRQFV